ncbi:hybrid sensor histidine kinase/response regulator [Candidatus Sumerlaeota bacterium]|nr:hybrid sensor histidine kinase/response regulator [Candidatus Sumerlaeota bacterium]
MDRSEINDSPYVVPSEEASPVVLIVDENPQSADLTATCLKAAGFEPTVATSLKAAREPIADAYDRIGALVVSTTLPGVTGREVSDELIGLFPLVPTVLLGEQMPEVDDRPVGSRLVFARLERPISAEAVAAVGRRCLECCAALGEIVHRRMFLEQSAYFEEPIARVLHDLNNQITGLKGGIDLMVYAVDMVRDPETQAKFSRYMGQFIQPSLAQVETMIRNWRQMRESRLRRASRTDLVDVARRAVAMAANPAERTRIALSVRGKEASLLRDADCGASFYAVVYVDQLATGLAHVVRNAVESIEDRADGRVLIEIGPGNDNMCVIRILDNGPGIPQENRMQVWRAFFTTKEHGKIGLGLSMAKQIVDKQQGQIECIDSSLGGAGIQILIPLAEDKKS